MKKIRKEGSRGRGMGREGNRDRRERYCSDTLSQGINPPDQGPTHKTSSSPNYLLKILQSNTITLRDGLQLRILGEHTYPRNY